MTSRSLQRRQLSRSKIELFTECPRCLYLDVARGIPRPSGPPFTLNNAVDSLMKAEFDRYRAAGEPHPLFATAGLDAVPFQHAELDRWRHNFTGVRWMDEETGWTLFGAVDDLWQARTGELIVADYKATARARDADRGATSIRPTGGRWTSTSSWSGARVSRSATAAGSSTRTATAALADFGDKLCFTTRSCPTTATTPGCSTLSGARSRRSADVAAAAPGPDCDYCAYVASASGAG